MSQHHGYLSNADAVPNFRLDCPVVVHEYCQLATKGHLLASEIRRMDQILKQAESDGWLDFWLSEADHFLAHELELTTDDSIYEFENQQAKLREYLEEEETNQSCDSLLQELKLRLRRSSCELQQHLKARGFDPGVIDGVLGQKTRDAILAFQRAHQLIPNGLPDALTREALGLS